MLIRFSYRLALLALVSGAAFSDPVPRLNAISREWIQRGTKTQVSITGENLANATNVIVSGAPGVSAMLVPPSSVQVHIESSAGGVSSVVRPDGKFAHVALEIDSSAALTDREIRLVSRDGVSNPVMLRVSPLPELDSSKNQSPDAAQKLELPVAINGTIGSAAESDFFRFSAKKGEHVMTDVYAFRLGSKLDSSLAILDKSGKELARNEDAVGLDSVLDFNAPEDGEYLIELRDFRYQGGGEFKYRMLVGALPHVNRVFPFGGQRGQTIDLALEGVNLDSGKLSLSVASDAPLGRQEIRASSAHGLSNPFPLAISDLPHISESEPNSALDQADRISIPIAVNGKIGKKKDYDAFRFHAAADQRILFEVTAARFGSRLDALLTLTDSLGKVLLRNDDAAGEDARLDYTFKEAGNYFIVLEDLLGRGGENYGYRLTAETPAPDFSVTVLRDTPRIRRAGHVPIRCEVNRMNGFEDAVTIVCEDLPPGVYAEPLVLPSPAAAGFLVINAAAQAALGSFPLKIVAHANLNGNLVRRAPELLGAERTVKEAFLTVLDLAPFSITPATLMANFEQNQNGAIDVVVERRSGFKGEIRVTAEGFSAGRDAITKSFDVQPLTIKAGETRGTLTLKTKIDSEIGVRPIVLRAEADPEIVDYSSLIPVAAAQIPFVLSTSLKKLIVTAVPMSSGSSASEAVFNAKADRRDGFEGEISLKLDGVPEGVTATITNIMAKANEAALKLVAMEKAPTGTNIQLTLTGTGQHKDRTYRFQAAPITLTINAPESEEKKEPKLAEKK
jgi:hypothetical protein